MPSPPALPSIPILAPLTVCLCGSWGIWEGRRYGCPQLSCEDASPRDCVAILPPRQQLVWLSKRNCVTSPPLVTRNFR